MIQKRNIAMYIILSIVTCGIFGIYWFICLTDDSKLAANDNESASGPVAFLLTIVTCGAIVDSAGRRLRCTASA